MAKEQSPSFCQLIYGEPSKLACFILKTKKKGLWFFLNIRRRSLGSFFPTVATFDNQAALLHPT